ncbi:sensor histidine kinase [Alkaliphilus transvaalensis]|uniref:sensor histidine kinase n=1 Tax=Alkaliphilus transvaalensis TaxID=114628 RepID=UPI00047BCB1E|nr:sensor histidine kinase [Alkaliphilus transvaalensis]
MKTDLLLLKKEFNKRIFKYVFLTFFIMGVLLSSLLFSHNYYKNMVIRSQQENILNIVTTVSAQLEDYFETKDNYLEAILKDSLFQGEFNELLKGFTKDVKLIDLMFKMGREEYTAIELIDREGNLLRSYTDDSDYNYNLGEDIVRTINTHNKVYFVETLGDLSINIIHPVKYDGELQGLVRMKINTDQIYRVYLANYQLNQKGYISLKDKEGRLFLHPSNESIGENVIKVRQRQYPDYDWRELEENVEKQMNRETGVGMYHSIWPGDDTRVKKISGFTPADIGDTFIILNFSVDYEETLISFTGITNATIIISILLILASIVIILYIFKVEIKRNELQVEAIYYEELREKNALIIHQSKFTAMGEMLATIAHQLKQPLNALKISLYNVEDFHRYDEKDEGYLNLLLESNHRLVDKIAKTIDDFKFFFKPQEESVNFNVMEAIEFSIELNKQRINSLDVQLDLQGQRQIEINGEGNVFSQVILNLINNSIDALKDVSLQRKIIINVFETETDVVIEISDNGGGICEEVMKNLFSPYITTKGEQGTGLGLYISRYIIREKFHGELLIENIEEGVLEKIIVPKKD